MALITGHSGAGKSTLLRLIAAIERPTSGSIIVNGQNIGALKSGAIPFLRRNLGLVFQDQKILFDRTVFDNVLLPLQISGFDSRAATGRVRAALDKVGLLDREKTLYVSTRFPQVFLEKMEQKPGWKFNFLQDKARYPRILIGRKE